MFINKKCFDLNKINIGNVIKLSVNDEYILYGLVDSISFNEIKILALSNKSKSLNKEYKKTYDVLSMYINIRDDFTIYSITIEDIDKYNISISLVDDIIFKTLELMNKIEKDIECGESGYYDNRTILQELNKIYKK